MIDRGRIWVTLPSGGGVDKLTQLRLFTILDSSDIENSRAD